MSRRHFHRPHPTGTRWERCPYGSQAVRSVHLVRGTFRRRLRLRCLGGSLLLLELVGQVLLHRDDLAKVLLRQAGCFLLDALLHPAHLAQIPRQALLILSERHPLLFDRSQGLRGGGVRLQFRRVEMLLDATGRHDHFLGFCFGARFRGCPCVNASCRLLLFALVTI